MKSRLRLPLTVAVLTSSCILGVAFAAPQDVNVTEATCDTDCVSEGVSFSVDGVLTIKANQAIGDTANVSAITGVDDTGSLEFSGDSTVSGKLGDAGLALKSAKVAAGTVEFEGPAFINSVEIKGGTLLLNDSLTGNVLTVAEPGTLRLNDSKTLTLATKLDNSGRVDVSTHTLTIAGGGPFNQSATGSLSIVVSGGAAPSGLLIAATTNLDPNSTVRVTPQGELIADGTKYTIIQSTAPVIVPVVAGNTPIYQFALAQNANDLDVTVTRNSFAQASMNPSLAGLSSVLEDVAQNPLKYPLLDPIVASLALTPTQEMYDTALESFAPLSNGSVLAASQNAVNQGIHNISNRMELVRLGVVRSNGSGYSAGDWDTGSTAWMQIYGNSLNQKHQNNFEGYHGWNSGFTFGIDKDIARNTNVGVGFNYGYLKSVSKNLSKNEVDAQSFQALLYSSMQPFRDVYWDTVLSAAYHNYNTKRFAVVPVGPGFNQRADADFGAWQSTAWTEVGYEALLSNILVTPYMNAKFSHTRFDSIQERGNRSVNLIIDYDNANEFVLGGGLRIGYASDMDSGVIMMPSVFAEVNHDFINDRIQSNARFINGGASFVTPGIQPAATAYRVGVAVDLVADEQWSASLSYDYEMKHRFHMHGAFLKLRYSI